MVMIATSSRASGCWDSLGCPCGIFFERDPWKSTFFRYKTGSISVTGSLSAARTRVYDTNPPLVGLVGLVFSDYRRYAWFSCRSTQDRKRGQRADPQGPRSVDAQSEASVDPKATPGLQTACPQASFRWTAASPPMPSFLGLPVAQGHRSQGEDRGTEGLDSTRGARSPSLFLPNGLSEGPSRGDHCLHCTRVFGRCTLRSVESVTAGEGTRLHEEAG